MADYCIARDDDLEYVIFGAADRGWHWQIVALCPHGEIARGEAPELHDAVRDCVSAACGVDRKALTEHAYRHAAAALRLAEMGIVA